MKTIITLIILLFTTSNLWSQCESAFEYQQNGTTLIFTNTSTAADGETIDFVSWTFGDGEELTGGLEDSLSYTYAGIGDYEVCLTILTSDLCEQESCQTIEMQTCTAFFNYENDAGTIYILEDASFAQSDILTYQWTINGNLESEDASFYAGLSSQSEVCLQITTADGCESEWCMDLGEDPYCAPPTNLEAYSDSLYKINVSFDLAEEVPDYYIIEVYDTDNDLVKDEEVLEGEYLFDSPQFAPCDTFRIVVAAYCGSGVGYSEPTDTVEVVSLCFGCEISLTGNQIGDNYISYQTSAQVSSYIDSYVFTLDGVWVSNEDNVALIVENGQEVCVTLYSIDDCSVEVCEIVDLPEPVCPSPEILSITENEFGEVTVTIEEVPEANSYIYEFYQNFGGLLIPISAQTQTGYEVAATSYTFENTNMIPCSVYQVKVRSSCATQMGYYTPVVNTSALCESGCEVRFIYDPYLNGVSCKAIAATQSEVSDFEWSVDGIAYTGNNITLEDANLPADSDFEHLVCLEIFTDDGCNAIHCELVGEACIPVVDITTFSEDDRIMIHFNGTELDVGQEIRILNQAEEELYYAFTEEQYVIMEVADLNKCEEYIVEVMNDCPGGTWFNLPTRILFTFDCEDGCVAEFDFIGQGTGLINCINTSQSLDELSSYEWTIDGEFMSNEENPSLVIDELTGQEICLTITSTTECSSQYCEFIQTTCPYTEIISLESYGFNQINLSVIEDDPSFAFETLVFDSSGNLLVSQNTLGPVVNIQDASLSACTEYWVQIIVKCQEGVEGFASAPQSIITECDNEYCPSGSDGSAYIENVSINGFENTSINDNGYGDYSSLMIPLIIGEETILNVSPNFESDTLEQKIWVYADWNNDYVFSENELIGESAFTTTAIALNISVPNSVASTSTRMRIVMSSEESIPACGAYSIGETEDYSVALIDSSLDYCHANFNITYTENEIICIANTLSSNEVDTFSWLIDEETVGSSESINLNIENSQEICLNITSANGCEDTYCQSIELNCEINFSYQAEAGIFDFEAIAISEANISSYEWSLDSLIVSEEKSFTYDAGIADGQEMCLTVNALGGCSATYCEEFNFSCNAAFDYDIFNQTLFVIDESWSNGATGDYDLFWDFGDGTSSTEIFNTYHLYYGAAFYDLCLTISSPYGCEDTHCASISAGVECSEPEGIDIEVTENTLSATWEAFEGADAYRIQLYEGFISVHVDTIYTNSIILGNLLACQDYVFRVHNLCGNEGADVDTELTTDCPDSVNGLQSNSFITNYPNPSNQSTTISFRENSGATELIMTNIMGQEIASYNITPNTNQIEINTSNLPNGTYLYQIKNQAGIIGVNKLLVLHY